METTKQTSMDTKASISETLLDVVQQFAVHVNRQDEALFTARPDGKWSAGQHLDHLLKSTKLLNKGLHKPKFLYRFIFDKNIRDGSRSFDELKARYYTRLEELNGVTNPSSAPGDVTIGQKKDKLMDFLSENKKLIKKMNTLSDKDLDGIVIPHPSLGKITIREMMNFMIFHTQHHLNTLKSRV